MIRAPTKLAADNIFVAALKIQMRSMFHVNWLLADDSNEMANLIFTEILKIDIQHSSSAAVVTGTLTFYSTQVPLDAFEM